MKFYCNGADLAGAGNVVGRAVASNKNIPILEGIKIKAEGKNITLSAYDQQIYIEKTVDADIYEEGELMVNGRLFSDCVNRISGMDRVCIEEVANGKINISYGQSNIELNYYNVSGFTSLGDYDGEKAYLIKEKDLKELFDSVIFCVSTINDNRAILKSCNVEITGDICRAFCLDGYRLAIAHKEIKNKNGNTSFAILGKTASDIIKILGDSDDEIKIINDENKTLLLDLGHTKIRCALTERETFNYNTYVIKDGRNELIVNKNDLEAGLSRVSIISREASGNAVYINVGENNINIFSETEKGRVNENISCKYKGENIKFCINNKFLIDAINHIKEDFVKILIENEKKPINVKKVDGEDYNCVILLIKML